MLAALALMLELDRRVGGLSVDVPALFGNGVDLVFLRTYLPLLWMAAIADSFAGRGLSLESRPAFLANAPVSRLGLHDAALFVLASSIAAILHSGASSGESHGIGPVLVLSGVACLGTLRAGPAVGAFASTILMLATSMYPRTAHASRFVHILQSNGEPTWSATCGLVICLMTAIMLATNSVPTRLPAAEASEF